MLRSTSSAAPFATSGSSARRMTQPCVRTKIRRAGIAPGVTGSTRGGNDARRGTCLAVACGGETKRGDDIDWAENHTKSFGSMSLSRLVLRTLPVFTLDNRFYQE